MKKTLIKGFTFLGLVIASAILFGIVCSSMLLLLYYHIITIVLVVAIFVMYLWRGQWINDCLVEEARDRLRTHKRAKKGQRT